MDNTIATKLTAEQVRGLTNAELNLLAYKMNTGNVPSFPPIRYCEDGDCANKLLDIMSAEHNAIGDIEIRPDPTQTGVLLHERDNRNVEDWISVEVNGHPSTALPRAIAEAFVLWKQEAGA